LFSRCIRQPINPPESPLNQGGNFIPLRDNEGRNFIPLLDKEGVGVVELLLFQVI
jgi:hypothetical protein